MTQQDTIWLDFSEAANYLRIKKSHLYQLTKRKALKFFKPTGKNVFFRKSDLDEFMLSGEVKPDSQQKD